MANSIFKLGSWLLGGLLATSLAGCGSDDDDNSASAQKPGAASVTTEVSTKSLTLSWDPVAGADSYRVYHDPDGSSGLDDISGALSGTEYQVSLAAHLTDWEDGRFVVEACNSAGCTPSGDLFIEDAVLDAIGYFKAASADNDAAYGFSLALSEDGSTLAVGSPRYDLSESDFLADDSGTVYLYAREDGDWVLRHQFKNPAAEDSARDYFGYSVSLSADGTKLLISAPQEDGGGRTINEPDRSKGRLNSGAAFLYESINGQWQETTYFKASNADTDDYFGIRAILTPDGNTALVSAPFEASNDVGINGNQDDNSIPQAGAVYAFENANGEWAQTHYIKPAIPSQPERFCFDPRPGNNECYERAPSRFGYGLGVSNDGNTLAIGAPGDGSITSGINGSMDDYRGKNSGAVFILRKDQGVWEHTDYIKSSNPDIDDEFGYSLALSADGNTLAVGAPYEDSLHTGVTAQSQLDNLDFTNEQETEQDSGAAYLFSFDGSNWAQTSFIKAQHADENDLFGFSISLDAEGKILAVGVPRDDSEARGISELWSNGSDPAAGGAYVYRNLTGEAWTLGNYVKASNTDANDTFGRSLTLSADGATLAVAATGEDSRATGVNGDQADDTGDATGAVYLY